MCKKVAQFEAECDGIQINDKDNEPFKHMTFFSERIHNKFEEWNEDHNKDWIQSLKIIKVRN